MEWPISWEDVKKELENSKPEVIDLVEVITPLASNNSIEGFKIDETLFNRIKHSNALNSLYRFPIMEGVSMTVCMAESVDTSIVAEELEDFTVRSGNFSGVMNDVFLAGYIMLTAAHVSDDLGEYYLMNVSMHSIDPTSIS